MSGYGAPARCSRSRLTMKQPTQIQAQKQGEIDQPKPPRLGAKLKNLQPMKRLHKLAQGLLNTPTAIRTQG